MAAFLGRSPSALRPFVVTLVVIASAAFFTTPARAGLGRVVALGDSYATGTGLGPQLPGSPPTCDRTTGGFPEVAMSKTSHGTFINQACNGSKTQAFFYGSPGIPEQVAVLDGSERVVIIAIGGNNSDFGSVAANCLIHDYNDVNGCTNSYGSGAANTLPSRVTDAITTTQGFAPSVGSTLDQIHAISPQAQIFLVGYLRIAPPDGASCNTPFDGTHARSYLNLTPTDAPVYAAWEDTMQTALASEASGRSYAHFVNMQPASNTHNACTPASQRWVNSLPSITPDTVDGLNLHPSSAGAAAVSSALLSAMSAAGLNLGPDITISAPASGGYTTSATATLTYSAASSLGTPDCSPASGSNIGLSAGTNTITVNCSDSAGNASSASTTISRGSVPVVAITAPSAGTTHTTSSSANVAYTVDGSTSIPNGTTCKIGDLSSANTQTNPYSLALGNNTITVSCTNAYGVGSASFGIARGNIPSVAIVAPSSGASTSSTAVNVSFTVSGSSAIPSGTTCTVNSAGTTSATVNAVSLSAGLNSIEVACSNAFGDSSASASVTRGDEPSVAITGPENGSTTTSSSTVVAFTVNGSSAIPPGTTCKVGASDAISTSANLVNLAIGTNPIAASCTNAFGTGQASVVVTREGTPSPTPPTGPTPPITDPPPIADPQPSPLTASISTVSPGHFSPLKKGSTFSRTLVKGAARVRVTLSAAASVRLRIERLPGGKPRSGWSDFELPAGISNVQLSGRVLKRALPAGSYRLRLAVRGTSTTAVTRSFRIDR
jgi:lysophospholipase L1-like esterase